MLSRYEPVEDPRMSRAYEVTFGDEETPAARIGFTESWRLQLELSRPVSLQEMNALIFSLELDLPEGHPEARGVSREMLPAKKRTKRKSENPGDTVAFLSRLLALPDGRATDEERPPLGRVL